MAAHYTCQRCKNIALRWSDKCPMCGAWNAMLGPARDPVTLDPLPYGSANHVESRKDLYEPRSRAVALGNVPELVLTRIGSGIASLDRVAGGGLVLGASYLFAGGPGAGKSTVLGQVLSNISMQYDPALNDLTDPHAKEICRKVLYVSGEEGLAKVADRSRRLGVAPSVLLLSDRSVQVAIETIDAERPHAVVIDSAQTLFSDDCDGMAGGVSQVMRVTSLLVQAAERVSAVLFIICHVTKDGNMAGPKTLEHLVDCVLSFEVAQEPYRVLRSGKNRFGASDLVAHFEMRAEGLEGVTRAGEGD